MDVIKILKKIFKTLSGRPKPDSIVECIVPIVFVSQLTIASLLVFFSARYQMVTLGMIGLIFAWQAGWGMSIERFMKNETK